MIMAWTRRDIWGCSNLKPPASASSYLPRLDGIRAVAIGFVLLEHFSTRPIFVAIGIGGIGVRMFFVLSGFLITRILLDYRVKGIAPADAARQFYWRRLLRLSPPYYLAIAAGAALGIAGMRQIWWVHCLYLSNFYALWIGHWYPGSHLWSLSVEEQFYLLWFLVVMVLPRRFFLPVVCCCIIGAPLYRAFIMLSGFNPLAAYAMLPAAMDALALGALLAYLVMAPRPGKVQAVLSDARFLALSIAAVAAMYVFPMSSAPFGVIQPSILNLAAASFIWISAAPRKNWLVDWLGLWPLRHIGRISYGIYIVHQFIPMVLKKYLPGIDLSIHSPYPGILRMAILVALSVMAAEISWFLVERPVLRWRHSGPGAPVFSSAIQAEASTLLR